MRTLTPLEQIVELKYDMTKLKILLHLISEDIGMDKVIELAKDSSYPKTREELVKIIKEGKICDCEIKEEK